MTAELHVDALIFDLDGTLVDTLDDIADALDRALSAHGQPVHARADYRSMIGGGAANLVARALPSHARQLVDVVLDAYRREYHARLIVRSAPCPGIPALLATLAEHGVPSCVLSNKPHAPTCSIIAQLFGGTHFVEVAGDRPERPRKPDPGVARELAARMGVSPARCGFVGDSGIDMQTARAAGMRGFGVTWGFRDRDELLAQGADALIDRPERLLAFVRKVTAR